MLMGIKSFIRGIIHRAVYGYVRLNVKHILFEAFSRSFDQLQPARDLVEQINPHLAPRAPLHSAAGLLLQKCIQEFCVKVKQIVSVANEELQVVIVSTRA